MSKHPFHDFGVVDEQGDAFEFYYGTGQAAECRLEAVIQTERGPKRTEMAVVPAALWRKVSVRAVRELSTGMGEEERTRKAPTIKTGSNRLGPLIGRELAVLLWAVMEEGGETRVEGILHGWRELAREERWWLFAKGTAPGQHAGAGWRRALFHGLSEPGDSRSVEANVAEKKSPQNTQSQQNTQPNRKQSRVVTRKKQTRETSEVSSSSQSKARPKSTRKRAEKAPARKQTRTAVRKKKAL